MTTCADPSACCAALSRAWAALGDDGSMRPIEERIAELRAGRDDLSRKLTQALTQADAWEEIANEQRQLRESEVEYWVKRYNELDAWRQSTAKLLAESEAKRLFLEVK